MYQISQYSKVILTGDFNAHSPAWGSQIAPNARGNIIQDLFTDGTWCICNDGSPTRINLTSDNKSAPDITVVSPAIQDRIYWRVENDPMVSDHYPIFLELAYPHITKTQDPRKIRLNKIDWHDFGEKIGKYTSLSENQLTKDNYITKY